MMKLRKTYSIVLVESLVLPAMALAKEQGPSCVWVKFFCWWNVSSCSTSKSSCNLMLRMDAPSSRKNRLPCPALPYPMEVLKILGYGQRKSDTECSEQKCSRFTLGKLIFVLNLLNVLYCPDPAPHCPEDFCSCSAPPYRKNYALSIPSSRKAKWVNND